MNPRNVQPQNFQLERIIYDDGDFSIAVGVWQDDMTKRFAMRWNGNRDDQADKGYPTVFGNPMWFQMPTDIRRIISALIDNTVPITATP